MSDFYVDIPGLRKAAGEIGDAAKELESAIAELSKGGATSFLSGAGAADIDKQLGLLSEELLGCNDSIKTMSSELYQITDMYENTEKEVVASAEKCTADPKMVVAGDPFESGVLQRTAAMPKGIADIFANSELYNPSIRNASPEMKNFFRFINNMSGRILKSSSFNFLKVTPAGISYNWKTIGEVMSKPADQITPEEYFELAALFLDMGPSDMAKFLKYTAKLKETVHEENTWNGNMHHPNDYTVWEIDTEKIDGIQKGVMVWASAYDIYNIDLKDVKNELGFSILESEQRKIIFETVERKQDDIFRKTAILDYFLMYSEESDASNGTANGLGDGFFTAKENAKNPDIAIEYKDGSWELSYNVNNKYEHISQQKISIGKTIKPGTETRKIIEESNNYYVERYSPTVTRALSGVGKVIFSGAVSAALKSLPGAGIAASIGMEALSGFWNMKDREMALEKQNQFYKAAIVAENNSDFALKSVPISIGSGVRGKKISMTYSTGLTQPRFDAINGIIGEKKINLECYGFPNGCNAIDINILKHYPEQVQHLMTGDPIDEKYENRLDADDIHLFHTDYYLDLEANH